MVRNWTSRYEPRLSLILFSRGLDPTIKKIAKRKKEKNLKTDMENMKIKLLIGIYYPLTSLESGFKVEFPPSKKTPKRW